MSLLESITKNCKKYMPQNENKRIRYVRGKYSVFKYSTISEKKKK